MNLNRMQKNISIKFFLGIFFMLVLFFPITAMAQTKTTPKTPAPATSSTPKSSTAPTTGEVPDTWGCEQLKAQIEANGGGLSAELPEYCTEGDVYNRIVYWLYYIIGIGAVIMIIYGGYMYMTAGSNESQTKKAKNILLYTIAGIAVALVATTIIRVVINLIVENKVF
jgi:predicted permease